MNEIAPYIPCLDEPNWNYHRDFQRAVRYKVLMNTLRETRLPTIVVHTLLFVYFYNKNDYFSVLVGFKFYQLKYRNCISPLRLQCPITFLKVNVL